MNAAWVVVVDNRVALSAYEEEHRMSGEAVRSGGQGGRVVVGTVGVASEPLPLWSVSGTPQFLTSGAATQDRLMRRYPPPIQSLGVNYLSLRSSRTQQTDEIV